MMHLRSCLCLLALCMLEPSHGSRRSLPKATNRFSGMLANSTKPYVDAFRCLHPARAIGNSVTITSLEVLLLQQQRDPEVASEMVNELHTALGKNDAIGGGITRQEFQSLMVGGLNLSSKCLKNWHDALTQACFAMESEILDQWRGYFTLIDSDGDGYMSEEEFNTIEFNRLPSGNKSVPKPILLAATLFGTESPLIHSRGLGFFQFVKGTSEYFSNMLYRRLVVRRGDILNRSTFFERTSAAQSLEGPSLGERNVTALENVWRGLDEDQNDEVTTQEFADGFLAFFHIFDDGAVQFRPEDDIAFRYRRIKQWGGQCEAAISEECVARTCPKFCQSLPKSSRKSCLAQCGIEQRCKPWQPGMAEVETFLVEDVPIAAGVIEPVQRQTWAQFIACVAQKRHTSGYDGGDWRVITSPSYRGALAHLVAAQMDSKSTRVKSDTSWIRRMAPRSSRTGDEFLSLSDHRGVRAAAEGVFLAITSDESAIANVDAMVASAHKVWLQHQNTGATVNSQEVAEISQEGRGVYERLVRVCLEVLRS